MNSLWDTAENEVAKHAHLIGVFCKTAAAILLVGGITMVIIEKIKGHRAYLREKAKADEIKADEILARTDAILGPTRRFT